MQESSESEFLLALLQLIFKLPNFVPFHLLPKSDRKKPLHMTQVSNDDDSSKGTAVHTSKKNELLFTFSVSYFQNTIKKREKHFHDIHTF
jgi:hypothetical protein